MPEIAPQSFEASMHDRIYSAIQGTSWLVLVQQQRPELPDDLQQTPYIMNAKYNLAPRRPTYDVLEIDDLAKHFSALVPDIKWGRHQIVNYHEHKVNGWRSGHLRLPYFSVVEPVGTLVTRSAMEVVGRFGELMPGILTSEVQKDVELTTHVTIFSSADAAIDPDRGNTEGNFMTFNHRGRKKLNELKRTQKQLDEERRKNGAS